MLTYTGNENFHNMYRTVPYRTVPYRTVPYWVSDSNSIVGQASVPRYTDIRYFCFKSDMFTIVSGLLYANFSFWWKFTYRVMQIFVCWNLNVA